MTLFARSRRERRMNLLLEEFRVLGRMRVMADPAIDHIRIDLKMGLRKRLFLEIMACSAYLGDRLEEERRLGRRMRRVTR